MKKPATWQFLTLVVLLMALGGGITYWVQSVRLKAQFAARVPDRPVEIAAEWVAEVTELEQRIRTGDALAVGELGEFYRDQQKFEAAYACFLKMTELDSRNPRWALETATMEVVLDQRQEAKTRVTRLRLLTLPDGESYQKLGYLAEVLGEQVDAKGDYEKAVKLDPTLDETWLRLIQMYRAIGDEGAAIRGLEAAIATNPDSVPLRLDRGMQLIERSQWQRALIDMQRVITVSPETYFALEMAAMCYFELGQFNECRDLLLVLLDGQPEHRRAIEKLVSTAITMEDRSAADAAFVRWFALLGRQVPRSELLDQHSKVLRARYEEVFGSPPLETP